METGFPFFFFSREQPSPQEMDHIFFFFRFYFLFFLGSVSVSRGRGRGREEDSLMSTEPDGRLSLKTQRSWPEPVSRAGHLPDAPSRCPDRVFYRKDKGRKRETDLGFGPGWVTLSKVLNLIPTSDLKNDHDSAYFQSYYEHHQWAPDAKH